MKSKVTLIILIVLVVFFIALSFSFGCKYLTAKEELDNLNETVDTLTDVIDDVSDDILDQKHEETYYESEDGKFLLALIQYTDRLEEGEKECYFVLVDSYDTSNNVFSGKYTLEDDTLTLEFNKTDNSITGVETETTLSGQSATLAYDAQNDEIILGATTLSKVE